MATDNHIHVMGRDERNRYIEAERILREAMDELYGFPWEYGTPHIARAMKVSYQILKAHTEDEVPFRGSLASALLIARWGFITPRVMVMRAVLEGALNENTVNPWSEYILIHCEQVHKHRDLLRVEIRSKYVRRLNAVIGVLVCLLAGAMWYVS